MPTGEVDSRALITASTSDGEDSPSQLEHVDSVSQQEMREQTSSEMSLSDMESCYLFGSLSAMSGENASAAAIIFRSTEDEQIVNGALVSFLAAVTANCPNFHLEWRISRARIFVVRLGDARFEARTDGRLRDRVSNRIYGILEVKPFLRSKNRDAIEIQEGVQLLSWIVHDGLLPPGTRR